MDPAEYPSHATNVQPARSWAKVLNEKWPPAEIARNLRDEPVERHLPVVVRLEFETGEEFLEGLATRWVPGKHVRVEVADPRLQSGGVWVDPSDARPR